MLQQAEPPEGSFENKPVTRALLVSGIVVLCLLAIARIEFLNWLHAQRRTPAAQVAGTVVAPKTASGATAAGVTAVVPAAASTTLLVGPDKTKFPIVVPRVLPAGYRLFQTATPGWVRGSGTAETYLVDLRGSVDGQRVEICTSKRWQYLSGCGYERASYQKPINGAFWDCDTRSEWAICSHKIDAADVYVSIWVVGESDPDAVMATVARTLTTDLAAAAWFPK